MSPIQIHQTALIGQPLRPLQGFRTSSRNPDDKVVKHEGNLYVGPYSVIGEGVDLGNNVIIDSCCVLERGVSIGSNTLVVHRATIGGYSSVGRDCVIGGFVGEGTVIGNNCRIFGTLAHKQDDPAQSWDHREQDEPSVRVYDWTFIGFHAFVAGDIVIGSNPWGFDDGGEAVPEGGALLGDHDGDVGEAGVEVGRVIGDGLEEAMELGAGGAVAGLGEGAVGGGARVGSVGDCPAVVNRGDAAD